MSETLIEEISKINKNVLFQKNKIVNQIYSIDLLLNQDKAIEINGDHHLNKIISNDQFKYHNNYLLKINYLEAL
jgi:hypothetical protein